MNTEDITNAPGQREKKSWSEPEIELISQELVQGGPITAFAEATKTTKFVS